MERKRKIIPPVYLLCSLLAMTALHYLAPIARFATPPWSYLGLLPLLAGIVMSAVAAGSFKRAGTPVVPFEPSTVLVTGGMFRVTRNPMYLGMILSLLGAAVLFGTVGALLPIPVFAWIIQSQFIVGEERFLEEIFGSAYLTYKKRVRRWI